MKSGQFRDPCPKLKFIETSDKERKLLRRFIRGWLGRFLLWRKKPERQLMT
jgi:hypothetical protein